MRDRRHPARRSQSVESGGQFGVGLDQSVDVRRGHRSSLPGPRARTTARRRCSLPLPRPRRPLLFLVFVLVLVVLVASAPGEDLVRPSRRRPRALRCVLPLAPPSVIPCTSSGRSLPPFPCVEVQPVGRFGEPQERVDAGHHDPGIDGQDLDPHQGHPDEDVDDQALVEDELHDVGEAARPTAGRSLDVAAATFCVASPPSSATPPTAAGADGTPAAATVRGSPSSSYPRRRPRRLGRSPRSSPASSSAYVFVGQSSSWLVFVVVLVLGLVVVAFVLVGVLVVREVLVLVDLVGASSSSPSPRRPRLRSARPPRTTSASPARLRRPAGFLLFLEGFLVGLDDLAVADLAAPALDLLRVQQRLVIAWRRKCLNSSRARRPWARHRLPVRSNRPLRPVLHAPASPASGSVRAR